MTGENWEPKPYQERAIKMMMGQAAVGLFLDPGLGKTSICLAAFKVLKDQGLVERMLVIAPLRPCYHVWPNEIEKWADFNDLTYTILHGKDKAVDLLLDRDIYIINPEGLAWLLPEMGKNQYDYWKLDTINCDVLCIDESTKFKNSQSKRFKMMRKVFPKFRRRWALTGTPSPNGLMDLFGQIFILDGGKSLGSYITHFRTRFFHRNPYNPNDQWSWFPNDDAEELITEGIAPLTLRLSAKDNLEMPDLHFRRKEVVLPPKALELYKDIEDQFFAQLDTGDELVALSAAAASTKMRQIANGAVYYNELDLYGATVGKETAPVHNAKLDALEDLLGEIDSALIAYEFVHDKDRIKDRFKIPCLNDMNPKQAELAIKEFNAGGLPYLLVHPAGAGHGLNLQESVSTVIWFGITWDLELYDQLNARVWRQGQKADQVTVYHIVAKGTIDEHVLHTLKDKDRTQQKLLEGLKQWREQMLDSTLPQT